MNNQAHKPGHYTCYMCGEPRSAHFGPDATCPPLPAPTPAPAAPLVVGEAPMPAAWCNARRAEIQAYVDGTERKNHGETRTYLIELLAQLRDNEAQFIAGASSGNTLLLWALRYCPQEEVEYLFDKLSRRTAAGIAQTEALKEARAQLASASRQLEQFDGVRADIEILSGANEFPTVLDAQLHDLWKHTAPRVELETAERALAAAEARAAAAKGERDETARELSYERQMRQQTEQAMIALAGQVKELTAKLAREGEQEAQLLKRDEELRKLRAGLRGLVDVVWQYSREDQSVPSTPVSDRLIALAGLAPAPEEKEVARG